MKQKEAMRPQDSIPDEVIAKYISLDLLDRCRKFLACRESLMKEIRSASEANEKSNRRYNHLREYSYYLQRLLFKNGIPHMDLGSYNAMKLQKKKDKA